MRKVAVLMGGISSEREISLKSGQGVLQALNEAGYDAFPVDVTHHVGDLIQILEREHPDFVFNALHGKYGEDGCIQGVLNLMNIPYTHSGVLASAVSMDKKMSKRLASHVGLTVAQDYMVTKQDILSNQGLPMPYVVKPNDEGSSVGVFIVKNAADRDRLLAHWDFSKKVMQEEYIDGIELSVAVLDDKPLGVVEIVPSEGFYDFQHKYSVGGAQHIIPARIPQHIYNAVMQQALMMHQTLGCRGVTRTDFRYDNTQPPNERIVFLEINTNPGMTSISLVPELAKHAGMSYQELVVWLIERATCDK